MEPKLLLSSTTPLLPPTSSLFFLSYKSPLHLKPNQSVKTHLAISTIQPQKSSFWGNSLVLPERDVILGDLKYVPVGPIRAAVKRRKELPFDNVIQRDKKLKLVLKIRKILVSQPDRIMSLRELGRYRRELGLQKKRRFIALLKKFPAVFEIVEEGVFSLKLKLTDKAERLYLEELQVRNEMEDLLVTKLRKLLMMSLDKQILLEKIAHLKNDFALPADFRDAICHQYPQYFKVVATARGPALELTHWDPELAVSAAELLEEENHARELEEKDLIIDRPLKFNRLKLPRGLNLSKGEMRRICLFRDIPYISPCSDFSGLRSGTIEKEKHACAVVHELLSLTVEKKTLVDHITHFREEFRFSQQVRGMLIRHPDMFYVSLKGERDSVFLREAYRDSQLIDKDRLLIIKEKLRSIIAVPRYPRRGSPNREADSGEETNEAQDGNVDEGEEWSDTDNLMSDEDDEFDDDDDVDDWSDEDEDTPPDFNEDGKTSNKKPSKPINQKGDPTENEEKVLVPVLPDGGPRERW